MALSNFDRAENSLTLALAVLTEKVKDQATRQKLEKIMKKNLSRCAYAQGKFVKAIEALENIDDDDKYDILIKSFAHLGMEDKVQDLLDQVSDSDRYFSMAILSFKSKENSQEALDYLSKIDGNNNMFEATLLKGQIYWESGPNQNLDLAHQAFLLAAKSNPHSWLPFYYLGEFYKHPGHSKQNLDQHTETLIKADEQVRWEGRCGVMPISDIRPALPRPTHRSVQLSRAQAEQVVRIHGRSGRFLEFRIDSYE